MVKRECPSPLTGRKAIYSWRKTIGPEPKSASTANGYVKRTNAPLPGQKAEFHRAKDRLEQFVLVMSTRGGLLGDLSNRSTDTFEIVARTLLQFAQALLRNLCGSLIQCIR
jgi:hypothetical protein